MKDPKRFYTYAYLREDGTPYYIGKGEGNRAFYKKKTEIKPPKDKSKIIFLKQKISEEEAFKHEKYMINVFGRKDLGTGILRNRTDGGDGCSGWIPSKEYRKKLSEIHKGKTLSEETKRKIKEKRKYQIITKEQSNKVREKLKGKKRPDWVIEKIKRGITDESKNRRRLMHKGKSKPHLWKSFEIINPDGIPIKISNMSKFCKENYLYPASLNKVLNGTQSHHKGWTKIKENPEPYKMKKYILISPYGENVEIDKITEFCKENNLNYDCIRKVLNGKQRHHKGWTKPIQEL